MPQPSTLDLVIGLSKRSERAAAGQLLVKRLGVQELLLFVRDPQLGVLVPAPGFPQTLRGGCTWRSFLQHCEQPGRLTGDVELPKGTMRSALALVLEGTAAVLLGGTPLERELQVFESILPMLAAVLGAEQDVVLARAEAAAAKQFADHAHQLAAALELARADASKLNAEQSEEQRRKDAFLAMLGHELRNPLAPLVTSIELLKRHKLGENARERQLDVMNRQIRQLSRLIDDLLDVSRVSRGYIQLRRQPVALNEVLLEALEEARPLLTARGHEVDIGQSEEPLIVDGDRVRLVQIFGNLINNAVKYMDSGGRLTLISAREDDFGVIHVKDTGMGISAEMLPRIFDLFTQAPAALDRAQGGLGIGLTLVRTLIDLHGGQITAKSAGIGRGSTFSVRLPLAPASEAPAAPISSSGRGSPRRLRAVVVDDNRDAADSVASLLRILGHEADVAYDGRTALYLAKRFDADLVLLDIGMPGIDGYEVARRLRRIVRENARLVAVTGYGSDEARSRSRKAGFDEHIVKPVTAEALQNLIERTAAIAASVGC